MSELSFAPDLYEVLVIDNASTDDTKEATLAFEAKIRNLRHIYCEYPGLVAARHKGIDEAWGEILCYIDDDSFVTKNWLRGIDLAFSDRNVVLVGGPCLPEYEVEPALWLNNCWSEVEWGRTLGSLSLLNLGEAVESISPYYVYGCNFNIRKDALLRIGGFHPDAVPKDMLRFRGDGETSVSKRLADTGNNALYCPDVKIYHYIPASRMTKDYFCHRAFIQGISESFTKLRIDNGLDNEGVSIENNNEFFVMKIISRIKGKMKSLVKVSNLVETEEITKLGEALKKSYEEGFRYHQAEAGSNPILLQWILRENYLGKNSKMPI